MRTRILLLPVLVLAITTAQQQQVLSVEQPRKMKLVLQDPAGTIWGKPAAGMTVLARWTGKAWEDTPVTTLPRPTWLARSTPPWNTWTWQGYSLIPGGDNTFLAVVVRDVYQDAFAKDKNLEDNHRLTMKAGKELADKVGKEYWLEGWLLREGKWVGPLPIEKLLKQEQMTLVKNFTAYPKRQAAFNLQSDGKHLWAAYQNKVFVHEGDTVLEWALPAHKSRWPAQFGLCLLPDGRMLCSWAWVNEKGYHLKALRMEKGKIVAEDFPTPDWPVYLYSSTPLSMYVSRNKDLWLWVERANADLVWHFQQGKWIERKDLGRPLFEEADGSLWFLPGEGHRNLNDKDRGYRIVKGGMTRTYPWPKEYLFGWLTPAPSGELHAACGPWLVTLGRAADPLKRPIARAEILSQDMGVRPAFQDTAGNFVLPPVGFVVRTVDKK